MVSGLLAITSPVAVLADAVEAVAGFGLVGRQRASASFVAFAAVYGVLAVVAVPVANAGGLEALWAAVAVANLVLVAAQGALFARLSARAG